MAALEPALQQRLAELEEARRQLCAEAERQEKEWGAALAQLEADVKRFAAEVEALQQQIDQQSGDHTAQLRELEDAITHAESAIPENHRDHYRRIVARYGADALAAYVNSLQKVSRSPFRNADGSLTASGKAFQAEINRVKGRGGVVEVGASGDVTLDGSRWAAQGGFRRDVADHQAAGRPAEAAVREQGDRIT